MASKREEIDKAVAGEGVLGKALDGEVIFPLRAQDEVAPLAVIHWCQLILERGGSKRKAAAGLRQAADMLEQQDRLGCKLPD